MCSRDHRSGAAAVRLLTAVVAAPSVPAARELLEPLASPDVGMLTDAARAHGVEAWLAQCAPSQDGPWEPLARQRLGFVAAHVRELATLRELAAVLDGLDCPWLVLKGRALAEDLYPRPDMRHNTDIDILVPPAQFPAALTAFAEDGWTLLDRNWPLISTAQPGELRLRSARGILLDLHWDVVDDPAARRRLRFPAAGLLERRRRLPSGLPTLHPVDQLVHLGVHGALSGANRLIWLMDVALASRRVEDWAAVAARARSAAAGPQLALVLARARRVQPIEVPGSVLVDLAGVGWRLLCRAVDQLSPLGPRPDDPSLARSMARSARESSRASLVELARHQLAWLRSGAPRRRPPSPQNDPLDARSGLFAVDDDEAKDRYLAAVMASE